MKICVCIKQIFQTYAQSGKDPLHCFLSHEDRIPRINPHDEAAVALALKIAATRKEDATVSLITLGPPIDPKGLRRCLAMGADELWQINVPGNESASKKPDTWQKSTLLTQGIRHIGGDLVLCGKASLDNRNGQMGAFMAHGLGVPFVSGITTVESINGKGLLVHRNAGKGRREKIQCGLPAVLSVDGSAIPIPVPTHENQKKANRQVIHQMVLGAPRDLPRISSVEEFPPRPRPKEIRTPENQLNAFHRIQQLMTGSITEKKGRMVTGSPGTQVDEIMAFLTENKLLTR